MKEIIGILTKKKLSINEWIDPSKHRKHLYNVDDDSINLGDLIEVDSPDYNYYVQVVDIVKLPTFNNSEYLPIKNIIK